jgi:hypothetical protein
MPNGYNPHHNFSATVKTSKDAPRNPLAFNRSKQLKDFAPEAIELPFELELENIQKGSEQTQQFWTPYSTRYLVPHSKTNPIANLQQ